MKEDKIEYVQYDHNGLERGCPVVRCKPDAVVMMAVASTKGPTPLCVHPLGIPSKIHVIYSYDVLDEVHPDDYRKTAMVCISSVEVDVDRLAQGKHYQFHVDRTNFPYGVLKVCFNGLVLSTMSSDEQSDYIDKAVEVILEALPANQGYVSERCIINKNRLLIKIDVTTAV